MAEGPPTIKGRDLKTRLGRCKKEVNIVVVGRSGAGKSSLLTKLFKPGASPASTTELTQYHLTRSGIKLNIMDTRLSQDKRKREQQLKMLTDHKTDLVLFCVPVKPGIIFENENPQLMRALQECHGQNIWRHCLVVFTFSNLVWECVKKRQTATKIYTDYIISWTTRFREELIKMGVEKKITDNVKSIFEDVQPRPTIVTIPAGCEDGDPILPGIENEKWADRLFVEIMQTASRGALLQFRDTQQPTPAIAEAATALTVSVPATPKTVPAVPIHSSKETKSAIKQSRTAAATYTEPPTQNRTATQQPTPAIAEAATAPTVSVPATPKTISAVPIHSEARKFLECLSSDRLMTIGLRLGLRYANLKRMREGGLLDDMLDSWLSGDDNVIEKSGHPSWQSLIKALEEAGYNGVATEIRKGMCRIFLFFFLTSGQPHTK